MTNPSSANQRLSKMTFESRDFLHSYVTLVETKFPGAWRDLHADARRLIEEIDLYRKEHGWDAEGYGGEI